MIFLKRGSDRRPIGVYTEEDAEYRRSLGYRDCEAPAGAEPADDGPVGYEAMKVAELHDEIDRRNVGRDEDDLIPSDGLKADLVAALGLDDYDE